MFLLCNQSRSSWGPSGSSVDVTNDPQQIIYTVYTGLVTTIYFCPFLENLALHFPLLFSLLPFQSDFKVACLLGIILTLCAKCFYNLRLYMCQFNF